MDDLSNSFSLLELDAEDDKVQTVTAADNSESANGRGKGNKKGESSGGESSGDTTISKNENGGHGSLEVVSGECRFPLVWIDLEMTGLDIQVDRILEIACVITDGHLTKSIEGPDLVIHQTKECLDRMGEWCQSHHAASGLTERVLLSTISEQEAEKQIISEARLYSHRVRAEQARVQAQFMYLQVIEFVKRNASTYTPLLAGNSVYVDLQFLKKYMPVLAGLFSHVLVDVSSVKALCLRWYPKENKRAPQKEKKHRAMDDIKESIAELKYYKEHIFKAKTKR